MCMNEDDDDRQNNQQAKYDTNQQNEDSDDDVDEDNVILQKCKHCNAFFSSLFLPLHIQHRHSPDKQASTKCLEKAEL